LSRANTPNFLSQIEKGVPVKNLFAIAATAFALSTAAYGQEIKFDVQSSSHPFLMTNYGSDPALRSDDAMWGVLGTYDEQLYQVHAYNLFSDGSLITSDERKKENITDLPNVTDKLKKIRTVKYDLKKRVQISDPVKNAKIESSRKNHIGFLAQNLQTEFPELVEYDKGSDTYSVNYDAMVPVLLKAIMEQQAKIEALESKINK
jgi:hypothetical protein